MLLALMYARHREELVCDLAETYHIFNPAEIPARLLSNLAAGLRDDSRVKLALSGQRVSTDTLLRAIIADRLGTLIWFQTEDGHKGINRPESIEAQLMGHGDDKRSQGFDDGGAFEAARQKIMKGG